ncbi:MAG: hypothetical protein SXQ77_06885, partial [Halobacteria archaeon]|nr:hypothetical protein [Halobacteria archaeon]
MYANTRPDSSLPLWKFEYAVSRKIHRALFVFVIGVLGYHIFFTPRIYAAWSSWVTTGEVFAVLVLGIIAV